MLWDDDGVLCRMRPDRINTARTLIVDYKTGDTSAEPNTWGRSQMVRMGYYMAAASIVEACALSAASVRSTSFSYRSARRRILCSLVGVDEHGFELGGLKPSTRSSSGESALELAPGRVIPRA